MTIIKIEILDDGTLKLETDKVGETVHKNAEEMFAWLAGQMGGEVKTWHKHGHTHHSHGHGHYHTHNQ